MLYDELIADRVLGKTYVGFDDIQKRIAAAQKFILEEDFALAADGLVENFGELTRIAPFCRIPYPNFWIEFAHAHRAHWLNAPLHYPGFQSQPKRVGFLAEAKNAELTKWKTHLCWSLKEVPPAPRMAGFNLDATPLNCSVITIDYDISEDRGALNKYIEIHVAEFFMDMLCGSCASSHELFDISSKVAPIFSSDWASEIRYLFAVLGLLNARNAVESVKPDFARLNKARQRRGKLPMYDHTLLKIRALHRPSLCPTANSRERAGEIRAHFVRGHFKVRRSGVFWWGPHVRGNPARGFVEKDYDVAV